MAMNAPLKLGNWEKEAVLGKGAFGMVTLWKNVNTNEKIAIKVGQNMTDKAIEMWQNEVKFIRETNHPNIVAYKDIPNELQSQYPLTKALGMEYCSKGDLRKFLGNSDYCCGLPEALVRYLLTDMSAALCYLHQKKGMHRDLKPENIVLQEDPTRQTPCVKFKITDLGYAKDLNEYSCGRSYVGTMFYLAPELNTQARDALHYSQTVDYWSFGLLSYEVITGYRPFCPNYEPAVSLRYVINKHKHREIDNIIAIILERNPDEHTEMVPRNITSIPQPHHLNKHLAADLSVWLQSMLEVNANTRGGGHYTVWSKNLDSFLSKKYIEVINTNNMSVLHFEISDDTSHATLTEQIKSVTQVHQPLLLKTQGKIPNIMVKVVMTLEVKSPNLYFVYLYSLGNTQKIINSTELPVNLLSIHEGKVSHALGNERQHLAFAYDFYKKCFKQMDTFLGATSSLITSVRNHVQTLEKNNMNLEKKLTYITTKIGLMREIYDENLKDFKALNNNYGYMDEEYENLLQNADTELDTATATINELALPARIAEVQKWIRGCTECMEVVKQFLKSEWGNWKRYNDLVKSDYESKKSEIKESQQKLKIVKEFIKSHLLNANQMVNNFTQKCHEHINNLCRYYVDIHRMSHMLMDLHTRVDPIQKLPQQEALRKGIWKQIQPIADISCELIDYDTGPAYNAVENLNQGITKLLNVEIPVLNAVNVSKNSSS